MIEEYYDISRDLAFKPSLQDIKTAWSEPLRSKDNFYEYLPIFFSNYIIDELPIESSIQIKREVNVGTKMNIYLKLSEYSLVEENLKETIRCYKRAMTCLLKLYSSHEKDITSIIRSSFHPLKNQIKKYVSKRNIPSRNYKTGLIKIDTFLTDHIITENEADGIETFVDMLLIPKNRENVTRLFTKNF